MFLRIGVLGYQRGQGRERAHQVRTIGGLQLSVAPPRLVLVQVLLGLRHGPASANVGARYSCTFLAVQDRGVVSACATPPWRWAESRSTLHPRSDSVGPWIGSTLQRSEVIRCSPRPKGAADCHNATIPEPVEGTAMTEAVADNERRTDGATPYRRWQQQEGIPVHQGAYVPTSTRSRLTRGLASANEAPS